jgi:hypothetical protein
MVRGRPPRAYPTWSVQFQLVTCSATETPYLCGDRTSRAWSGVCRVELAGALVVRAHGWRDSGWCARGRPALLRSATLRLAPRSAT